MKKNYLAFTFVLFSINLFSQTKIDSLKIYEQIRQQQEQLQQQTAYQEQQQQQQQQQQLYNSKSEISSNPSYLTSNEKQNIEKLKVSLQEATNNPQKKDLTNWQYSVEVYNSTNSFKIETLLQSFGIDPQFNHRKTYILVKYFNSMDKSYTVDNSTINLTWGVGSICLLEAEEKKFTLTSGSDLSPIFKLAASVETNKLKAKCYVKSLGLQGSKLRIKPGEFSGGSFGVETLTKFMIYNSRIEENFDNNEVIVSPIILRAEINEKSVLLIPRDI